MRQSLDVLICPSRLYSEHSMQQSLVKGVSPHESLPQLESNGLNIIDTGLIFGYMHVLLDDSDQMFLEVMENRSFLMLTGLRLAMRILNQIMLFLGSKCRL